MYHTRHCQHGCDHRYTGPVQRRSCMRVIIVNSGSSSIKYETFYLSGLVAASKGLLERIGAQDSKLKHRWLTASGTWEEIIETRRVSDHREGFSFILEVSGRARGGGAV